MMIIHEIIRPRITLLLMFLSFSLFLYAQEHVVKGVVKDNNGPLPGVNVKVVNGKAITVTDIDGKYSINVPTDGVLNFSFTGYTSYKAEVKGRSVIDVELKEASQDLDEVVVVGYGTMRKRDITGAITSVGAKELINNAPMTLATALQGKVAGLEILSSSEPGATSTFRIRGASTIGSEGSNPLFIVDGMEMDNIDNINPRDIASVEVLKDAASAAIYGSKSANGVIIITTRQGSTSTPQVSVSYSLKQSRISHKLPQMNRQQGIDYEILRAYLQNSEPSAFARDTLNPSFTWDNNYQDILFRNAYTHQVDASISGAEKKLKYFLSAGYLSDEGIQLNSFNRRITSRVNTDYAATDNFLVSTRLSFATGNNRMVPYGGRSNILSRPASMALILPDGTYAPVVANRTNPLAYTMLCTNDNKYYDVNFNTFMEYKILKDLKFRTSIAASFYQKNYRYFQPAILVASQIPSSKNTHTTSLKWTHEDILTYNKTFNDAHSFSALGGFSIQQYTSEYVNLAVSDNITEAIETSSGFGEVDMENTKHSWTANRMASFFGRVSYNYKQRINHGAAPENAGYEYVLLPSLTKDETEAYASDPDIEIVCNTDQIQAVREKHLKILGINFWQAGEVDNIACDVPAAVMLQEEGEVLRVSVADPTWKQTTVQISLTGDYRLDEENDRVSLTESGDKTDLVFDVTDKMGQSIEVSLVNNNYTALDEEYENKPLYIREQGSAVVHVKNLQSGSLAAVYDLNGRQCYATGAIADDLRIDFSDYKKGVYIIRCSQPDGSSYVWKFVN